MRGLCVKIKRVLKKLTNKIKKNNNAKNLRLWKMMIKDFQRLKQLKKGKEKKPERQWKKPAGKKSATSQIQDLHLNPTDSGDRAAHGGYLESQEF